MPNMDVPNISSKRVDIRSASLEADAGLPFYSAPSLEHVEKEITRIIGIQKKHIGAEFTRLMNILRPELQAYYTTMVDQLEAVHAATGSNWATVHFQDMLLSLRTPLAETSLTFAFEEHSDDQAQSAAALLHGLAEIYTSQSALDSIGSDGNTERFETKQFKDLLTTTRRPGRLRDELISIPRSRHVIVWYRGRAFALDIIDVNMQPCDPTALMSEIRDILGSVGENSFKDPCVATLSTALSREDWAIQHARIKAQYPRALEMIENGIISIGLHDCSVTPTMDLLEATRASAQVVYSDKTLGFSVFADGSVAGRVDHTVADGGVIVRLSGLLHKAMRSGWYDFRREVPSNCLAQEVLFGEDSEILVQEARFDEPTLHKTRHTADINLPPDVLELLKSSKLLHGAIQLAFQAIVLSLNDGNESLGLSVEPVSVRNFKDGRCDPNYLVNTESIALLNATLVGESKGNLLMHFASSIAAYQEQIRQTREGAAIGPGVMLFRKAVSKLSHSLEQASLLSILQPFQASTFYFTGVEAPWVIATEATVFASDQLAFTYISKADRVTICTAGTGRFAEQLEKVQYLFEQKLSQLGGLATALACVEQMYPGRQKAVLAKLHRRNVDTIDAKASEAKCAVAVHAGAGEDLGLQTHEKNLVEFLLSIVTQTAYDQVTAGESAVDVAQKAVFALENCVFFNAGKGAVYNQAGEHELEAYIVDGSTGATGAVASVRTLRNPINAARAVMDLTEHSLLVGQGADEFGAASGLVCVPNAHFNSHTRFQQYVAATSPDTLAAYHPQAVGSIVLDSLGRLSVATSTGGVVNKRVGRVGDTAIVGAGCYADRCVAVACSGQGDAFLQRPVASRVAIAGSSTTHKILSELYHDSGATGAVLTMSASGSLRVAQTSNPFLVAAKECNKPMWSCLATQNVSTKNVEHDDMRFFEDEHIEGQLFTHPTTPGDTIVRVKGGCLSSLRRDKFIQVLLSAKRAATIVKEATQVKRVALVTTSDSEIRLIPLHGLSDEWSPTLDLDKEYNESYPGYISSKNGPKSTDETLNGIQVEITRGQLPVMDCSCSVVGDVAENLFARIIRGELKQWRIWESESHIAFLTPFANAPGYTVLVPRDHLSSDILSLADDELHDLAQAVWDVSQMIVQSSMDTSRVGIIFEGMEVNHAHAKLIPICRDESKVPAADTYKEMYTGSISSKSGPKASPADLRDMHSKFIMASSSTKTCP